MKPVISPRSLICTTSTAMILSNFQYCPARNVGRVETKFHAVSLGLKTVLDGGMHKATDKPVPDEQNSNFISCATTSAFSGGATGAQVLINNTINYDYDYLISRFITFSNDVIWKDLGRQRGRHCLEQWRLAAEALYDQSMQASVRLAWHAFLDVIS